VEGFRGSSQPCDFEEGNLEGYGETFGGFEGISGKRFRDGSCVRGKGISQISARDCACEGQLMAGLACFFGGNIEKKTMETEMMIAISGDLLKMLACINSSHCSRS